MNFVREAENYLKYYRELKQSLNHADHTIDRLLHQTSPKEMSAMNYNVTGIKANKGVNTINQMYQLQEWQEIKADTLDAIARVDECLNSISEGSGCEWHKDILLMWYIERLGVNVITDRFGCTERHVYRLKNKAITKFALVLFGVSALKAI